MLSSEVDTDEPAAMKNSVTAAVSGVVAAIVITTAMDATGYAAFSALILFPLLCLFWYRQRFSRQAMGLVCPLVLASPVYLPLLSLRSGSDEVLTACVGGALSDDSASELPALLAIPTTHARRGLRRGLPARIPPVRVPEFARAG